MYGYSNKSLGVILIIYPFSRLTVVGSFIEPMTYLAIDSWSFQQYQVFVSFHGTNLTPNQKVVTPIEFILLLCQ